MFPIFVGIGKIRNYSTLWPSFSAMTFNRLGVAAQILRIWIFLNFLLNLAIKMDYRMILKARTYIGLTGGSIWGVVCFCMMAFSWLSKGLKQLSFSNKNKHFLTRNFCFCQQKKFSQIKWPKYSCLVWSKKIENCKKNWRQNRKHAIFVWGGPFFSCNPVHTSLQKTSGKHKE